MPTIFIAECKQEVSSFNPVPSTLVDFEQSFGAEILDYHRGHQTEIGGALTILEAQPDMRLTAGYSARAITSAGTLTADSFATIADSFIAAAQAAMAQGIDAIYLSLHGAMSAVGEPDPEGYLLAALRGVVGEQLPIVASFDLHGVLTQRILQQCDAIVAYHTYPHIDFHETGVRSANLLLQILRGEVRPVTARIYIPALVRGPELVTETGLFGGMIRQAQSFEADAKGLSAGMFIGNPFTDVPDLATNSFVVANDDVEWAAAKARELADAFWSVRKRLHQPLIGLKEAIAQAKAAWGAGTAVLVDAADATSSGASGDSNAILAELIKQDYPGAALMPIVDAPAVAAAFAAGVGATINVTLGGQLDRARFTPLPVTAKVRMLSDGHFFSERSKVPWYAGNSAVLQVGKHSIITTSRAVSLYDRSLFWAHGQEPRRFDAVVVKSPFCEHHMFDAYANPSLNIDAPGSTSANLHYLGHTVCRRPIFPLDEGISFAPQVEIYRRAMKLP
ncbi:MAG: M81 family metallopeptidase [Caldilineaceae bacterium]|nr:M81 family metallopeptidase [Caldilineaceae bacterium]